MGVTGQQLRRSVKRALAVPHRGRPAGGATFLVYHRIAGGTPDERDVTLDDFRRQLDILGDHDVCSIDEAAQALEDGDDAPRVVITFDDGFVDVHEHGLPLLEERSLPFTIYLASAYVDGDMHWEGSTADHGGPGLSLEQARELARHPLCTIGNHTHTHVQPHLLAPEDLDTCTAWIEGHLGVTTRHFAYPWGVRVPAMEDALRARFRTAATCEIGRNRPGVDPMRLARVPVRSSDPLEFFRAKLRGGLGPELAYDRIVRTAKAVGARA